MMLMQSPKSIRVPALLQRRHTPPAWAGANPTRPGKRRLQAVGVVLIAFTAGGVQARPRAALPRRPLWDRVLHGRWRHADALLRKAVASAKAHRYAEATATIQRALRLRPGAASLWFALGSIHSISGHYPACVRALRRSRSLDPGYAPGLVAFRLGLCLSMSGRLAEALREYRRVGHQASVRAGILQWNVADTLMAMGRLREAITAYRQAIRRMPRAAVLRFALAVALQRRGRFEAAGRALRQGLRLDPTARSLASPTIVWLPASEPLYYQALIQLTQGRLAQAVETWTRFLRAAPDTPWQWAIRMHLRRLATRPLPREAIRAAVGSRVPQAATALLRASSPGLRACLRAPASGLPRRTLPAAVALRITLRDGRLAEMKILRTAGPVQRGAAPCLLGALRKIRWRAAGRGRAPITFTVSMLGRF